MSKATFRIKIYLLMKKFFVSFLDFEQNLFGLLTWSFWAWFSELQLRVHGNVLIKNYFFGKCEFFSKPLSVLCGFFSIFLAKIWRQSWQKCILYVQGTFRGKQTFWKNRTYLIFTEFERFASEIWQEASTELPKLHILC